MQIISFLFNTFSFRIAYILFMIWLFIEISWKNRSIQRFRHRFLPILRNGIQLVIRLDAMKFSIASKINYFRTIQATLVWRKMCFAFPLFDKRWSTCICCTLCSLYKTESHIVSMLLGGKWHNIRNKTLEITELIINSTIYADYQSKMF